MIILAASSSREAHALSWYLAGVWTDKQVPVLAFVLVQSSFLYPRCSVSSPFSWLSPPKFTHSFQRTGLSTFATKTFRIFTVRERRKKGRSKMRNLANFDFRIRLRWRPTPVSRWGDLCAAHTQSEVLWLGKKRSLPGKSERVQWDLCIIATF